MKKLLLVIGYWLLVIGITGCVVRTYPVTKDRVDQDLSAGNRGYLEGQVPEGPEAKEKKSTRTIRAVEIELHSPLKFEKMPKDKPKPKEKVVMQKPEDTEVWGNRGFITESDVPEVLEEPLSLKKYTVQKADTLQKISQKFYGTTRKWNKIYEVNRQILKGPDKIYPGQVIDIPVEPLKEPKANLK